MAYHRICDLLRSYPEIPEDTLIVFEIRPDEDRYYCSSWSLRRIFWPETTDITSSTIGTSVLVFDIGHLGTSEIMRIR